MKYVKPGPNIPKITFRKCQYCSTKTAAKLLYEIMGKWACLSCGNEKLREWNAMVAEAESGTINTVSPR